MKLPKIPPKSAVTIDRVCALVLFILAAVPRLYRLDLAQFRLDEANHYRMAYLLTRGQWRWTGSSASIGFPKPPLFVYALSLPLTLTQDPRLVIGFLGLLGALAAAALYLTMRRSLSRKAALTAALVFALTPQAILYARKLFTADLLPPLATLFLVAGCAMLERNSQRVKWTAPLAALAFALLNLTTFSPILLLPAFILLYVERRHDLKLWHWLSSAAALALPFAPYLIAVRHRLPTALAGADPSGEAASLPQLLDWIWQLSGAPHPDRLLSLAGAAALLWAILALCGLAFLLIQARPKKGHWARFLLAWLLPAPLLMLIVPIRPQPHYLAILYPALFVLPAAGVELLSRIPAARPARALSWAVSLFLVTTVAWQAGAWAIALPQESTPHTAAGYWWRIVEHTRALVEREGAEEALLLVPDDHRWNEQANILDALLSDVPHRLVDGKIAVVYPNHPTVMLIAPQVSAPASVTDPCTQDLTTDLTPALQTEGQTYHYRLWDPAHERVSQCTDILQASDVHWASGARLLGYAIKGTPGPSTSAPQPGETLHVVLLVETPQHAARDIHWFNQLEDAEGRRWAQLDHVAWPAERWRAGERVLFHFGLTISPDAAPGPYVLRVGQYVYHAADDLENIPVIDVAGNPADYAATLPVPSP